jgi:hypothetical protein
MVCFMQTSQQLWNERLAPPLCFLNHLRAQQLAHLARGAKVGAGTRTSVQLTAVILPRRGPVRNPSGDSHPAAKPQAALN